ncbi:uncharacterized protein MAM_02602 [Metarhizium album ARSEF 1941]|uniref:Uncharacterized protein n=1 Tax=Metarhizium album (strain ARSEF 1941) TaxID=1081103 RepID=A0A0B2X306_METAS|nr:uncharacterized protein MAM_02602 [Metarhizium album ARSEF 1941]KHN99749.1 hypothetical protein MAM_02602 [Metarhizium album ARSEF 1941]
MHANIVAVAAAAAALVSTSSALAVRNKHVGDFRLFSQPGCSSINLGIWTVLDDDVGVCSNMREQDVGSVSVVDITSPCTLFLYEDGKCSVGQTATAQGHCFNASSPQTWNSWNVQC